MTKTVRDQLVTAVRTDLTWLEARHRKWQAEVDARKRSAGWLEHSHRDLALARRRLEDLLEIDVIESATAQR